MSPNSQVTGLSVYHCVLLFVPLCLLTGLAHYSTSFVSCRVPVGMGGSLKPGAFPTCQPGSQELKGEPESPLMGTLSPNSPARSSCQPSSPAESNTCNKNLVVRIKSEESTGCVRKLEQSDMLLLFLQSDTKATPDPKACNWKKYKYIVLNPLCATTTVKVEEVEEPQSKVSPIANGMGSTPKASTEAWSGEVPGQIDR